jgi:SnoaL-like domain
MSTIAPVDIEQFAREYDGAWQAKDVEGIVARHAEDGTYQLHIAGAPEFTGREALRAAFTVSLENWSEISFQFQQALYGDRFYVWQSKLRGVLARPLALGALTIEANGARLEFIGCDVITLDAAGLIKSKETYFDILAMANQASAGHPAA